MNLFVQIYVNKITGSVVAAQFMKSIVVSETQNGGGVSIWLQKGAKFKTWVNVCKCINSSLASFLYFFHIKIKV